MHITLRGSGLNSLAGEVFSWVLKEMQDNIDFKVLSFFWYNLVFIKWADNVNWSSWRVKLTIICSDQWLMLETSALKNSTQWPFSLLNQLIKLNYLVSPSPPPIKLAPQLLKKLTLTITLFSVSFAATSRDSFVCADLGLDVLFCFLSCNW